MISDSVIKAWCRHQDTLPPLAFSYQLTVKKNIFEEPCAIWNYPNWRKLFIAAD